MCLFLLLSMTWFQVVADEPGAQRFFARSGDQVLLEGVETLRFHRFELKPSDGQTFTLPSVRAPLVLKGYDRAGHEVAELVVYPQEYKVWGREGVRPIPVRCQDAPAWFEQWADATGRGCEGIGTGTFATIDSPDALRSPLGASPISSQPRRVETTAARGTRPVLLVLGKDAAGGGPRCVLAVMERHRADAALVLEAGWYGSSEPEPYSLRLEALSGPFSEELELLGDPSPLVFSGRHQPAPALVNRRPCFGVKEDMPLVEELMMDGSKRVLVSYLPWQQRLGRSEQADVVFAAMIERLARVASQPQETLPDAGLSLVWPRPADVVESERPILYALLEREQPMTRTLYVADLRGEPIPVAKRSELLRALEHRPLLVLGTDPMLTATGSGVVLGQRSTTWKVGWPKTTPDPFRLNSGLGEWGQADRKSSSVDDQADGQRLGQIEATGSGVVFGQPSTTWQAGWPKTTPDPFLDVFWIEDDRLPPDEAGRYRLMVELTRLGVQL